MDALYLSTDAAAHARLCIAPLTRQLMSATGWEAADATGYFLFERNSEDPGKIEILARVADEDAALRLAQLLDLR